eukprot:scaffold3391_cov94-Skeletonema_marinoi.AAC.2
MELSNMDYWMAIMSSMAMSFLCDVVLCGENENVKGALSCDETGTTTGTTEVNACEVIQSTRSSY